VIFDQHEAPDVRASFYSQRIAKMLLSEFVPDQAATDTVIAAARAAFDRDPVSLDAVARSTFELWARPDQLARAGGQPTSVAAQAAPIRTTSTPAIVTDAGRARVRAIAAKANEADARSALLEEIGRKHGASAADGARGLSLSGLVKRAAAPTRAAISASWDRTFKLKGIAIHEDDPNETPIQQSWTRAFRRCGATVETTVPAAKADDRHGWARAMRRFGA
jgi:hypothetical protein